MALRHFPVGTIRALAVVALLALLVCGIVSFLGQRENVTFQDCGWPARAQAFVDGNADGVWDAGEPGLPQVEFLIDDTLNGLIKVGARAISDEQGSANLFVWLPGCPHVKFEVYAVPPGGYTPTTPARLSESSRKQGEPFVFGFTRQK